MSKEAINAFVNRPLKPLIFNQNISLGCDPEFFFAKEGRVIGSEKVLPERGRQTSPADTMCSYHPYNCDSTYLSKFIIDGVQAELNPRPAACRALLGNEIKNCFRELRDLMVEKGVAADFSQCVEVDKAEMDSLSDGSKVFGCAPSTNCYTAAESKITVDPKVYRGRSAGGHIHIGNQFIEYLINPDLREQHRSAYEYDKSNSNMWKQATIMDAVLKTPDIIVPVLDIVLGNTCVLIDRSPSNKERRKVYGRAGEYRIKDYGLEYRTLSNFWLRSYQLMSMIMGITRLTVHLVEQSTPENDYVKALFEAVKRENIVKAINENDFDLAWQNFLAIENILYEAQGESNFGNYPLSATYANVFRYFVNKGVDHWFEKDVINHWVTSPEGHGNGWESFLSGRVSKELMESMIKTPFNIKPPVKPSRWDDYAAHDKYKVEIKNYNKLYDEVYNLTECVVPEVKDPNTVPLLNVVEEPVIA